MPAPGLAPAVREAPGGVALGDHELGEPLEPDQRDQHGEGGQAWSSDPLLGGARSSTSSEQKPGPIAISMP